MSKEEYRACNICDKTDVETMVHSSSIGAMSCNYCRICSAMYAEPKGLEDIVPKDNYVTYDSKTDSYMCDGKVCKIVTKGKEEFTTRQAYVDAKLK